MRSSAIFNVGYIQVNFLSRGARISPKFTVPPLWPLALFRSRPVSSISVSLTPWSRHHPARCDTAEQFANDDKLVGFPSRQCVPDLFLGYREPRLAKARDRFVLIIVIKNSHDICSQTTILAETTDRGRVTMTALAWRTKWSSWSQRGGECEKLTNWLTVPLKRAQQSWRNGTDVYYFRLVGEMGAGETVPPRSNTDQSVRSDGSHWSSVVVHW